jgi:hypothetical protein
VSTMSRAVVRRNVVGNVSVLEARRL